MDHKTATYTRRTTRHWHRLFLCAGLLAALGMEECDLGLVSIESPTDGTTFTEAQTVTIAASALEGEGLTVQEVRFYRGDVQVSTDRTAPYTHAWPITAEHNGTHRFYVEADYRRSDGTTELLQSEEVVYDVTIETLPPTPDGVKFLGSNGGFGAGFVDLAVDRSKGVALASLTSGDLAVVDIREPHRPVIAAEFRGFFRSIAVGSSAAYVVQQEDGAVFLVVLQVANGSASIVSRVALEGSISTTYNGLAVKDDLLFVASTDAGLQIFDISAGFSPTPAGEVLVGRPTAVAADGDRVYVGTTRSLTVIDIRNKLNPIVELSTFTPKVSAVDIEAGRLYLFTGKASIFSADARSLPDFKNSWISETVNTKDLAVANGLMVGATADAVLVFDLSRPSSPQLLQELEGPLTSLWNLRAVATDGTLVLTGDDSGTLRIYVRE